MGITVTVRRQSGGSRRNLLLDAPAHGAIGYIEIIAGLQVDPELSGHAEVPPKANGGVCGDGTASAHDIVRPRARHLDRIGKLVDAAPIGDRNPSRGISPG